MKIFLMNKYILLVCVCTCVLQLSASAVWAEAVGGNQREKLPEAAERLKGFWKPETTNTLTAPLPVLFWNLCFAAQGALIPPVVLFTTSFLHHPSLCFPMFSCLALFPSLSRYDLLYALYDLRHGFKGFLLSTVWLVSHCWCRHEDTTSIKPSLIL